MERVSCVRTALEACYNRIVSCEHINDFTFSFVAPLEAEYYIKFHCRYIVILLIFNCLEWEIVVRHVVHKVLRLSLLRLCECLLLRLV